MFHLFGKINHHIKPPIPPTKKKKQTPNEQTNKHIIKKKKQPINPKSEMVKLLHIAGTLLNKMTRLHFHVTLYQLLLYYLLKILTQKRTNWT